MENIIQLFIYGLQLGSVYALVALGYTMVYGIVRLINSAHGDYLMLGAYTAFYVNLLNGENLILCLLGAMIASGLIAVLSDILAFKPVREQPKFSSLVTAMGVSLFIQNLSRALPVIGPIPKPFPTLIEKKLIHLGNITVSSTQILMIVIAFVLLILLKYIVDRTKTGRAMRAVSLDRDASALMGVNINKTITITFFIGGCLAGAGGVFYGIMYPTIDVSIGSLLGNKAFIAAVIGGIGNLNGAMVGGIMMGLIEIYATSINADIGFGVFYLILIVILIFKPAGLFGKLTKEKV